MALGVGLLWLETRSPAQAFGLPLVCGFSMSTVAFGSVDVLPGTAITSNGVLTVSCLNVQAGSGSLYVCVAFPTPRAMQGPSATLAWDLFGPPPATSSWSNITAIVIPMTSALTSGIAITIPANILAAQSNKPPGFYAQTLTATGNYGTSSCTDGMFSGVPFSFQANATVLKSCVVSATNLDFGSVGDLNAVVDGQSQISVQCTAGTGYTLGLDGGLSGATDPTARKMTAGTDTVVYGLYQNAGRTSGWGAASGSNTLGGTGTAATQTLPVYGRVPVQPTPLPATYSDTVVASVTY